MVMLDPKETQTEMAVFGFLSVEKCFKSGPSGLLPPAVGLRLAGYDVPTWLKTRLAEDLSI
jgi:hypothetical protein